MSFRNVSIVANGVGRQAVAGSRRQSQADASIANGWEYDGHR